MKFLAQTKNVQHPRAQVCLLPSHDDFYLTRAKEPLASQWVRVRCCGLVIGRSKVRGWAALGLG